MNKGMRLLGIRSLRTAFYQTPFRMVSSCGVPEHAINVDDVVFTEVGGTRIIELNRPKTLNALTLPMIHRIYPHMQKWENNPDIKLVIIKGQGDKSFCAGGDVRSLVEGIMEGKPEKATDFFRDEYKLNYLIGTFDVPYVAFLDGIVMGGGVGLSVHAPFRVATERSVFAMPETAIGLFPDVGGGHFLPRLQGKLGLFLALTGYRLKARDLVEAGIATHYCNSKILGHLENELVLMKPEEMKKDTIHAVLDNYHDKSKESYTFSLWPHLHEIDECFSAESVEEIIDRLKMNGSDWANKQVSTLQQMSPLSLKLTLRQLDHGAAMSLKDVLIMEHSIGHTIAHQNIDNNDFVAGVKAVLIEKHGKPVWNPATLPQITDQHLDTFFAPLPEEEKLKLTS